MLRVLKSLISRRMLLFFMAGNLSIGILLVNFLQGFPEKLSFDPPMIAGCLGVFSFILLFIRHLIETTNARIIFVSVSFLGLLTSFLVEYLSVDKAAAEIVVLPALVGMIFAAATGFADEDDWFRREDL